MSFPRYPAYKPSGVEWLGEVPEHWDVTALKHGYVVTLGKMLQPEAASEEDILLPYLRAANIRWSGVDESDIKTMWFSRREREHLRLQVGDLLVSEGGDVGRAALWKREIGECYFQNSVNRVRPRNGNLASFLRYWISTMKDKGFIDVLCNKSTIAHFTAEKVGAVPVPLPPTDEQQAIATFLDRETAKIDALIAEQQRLIELLHEKRQAVISQAVTKGLNQNAPMKDSGVEWLGEVPEHWDVGPIKHHWLVIDCKHVTSEFTEDGYPLASIREVQGRWVLLETAKRTTEDFYELLTEGNRKPESGDLVFSRNATVGEVAEVPENAESFALGQDVVLLKRQNKSHSSSYAWHLLRSTAIVNQLECAMIGSTFRRINVEQIKALAIPIPPPEEQALIATHLESIGDTWAQQSNDACACVSLLQERRSALISAAVTGQIDVRGLVPDSGAA